MAMAGTEVVNQVSDAELVSNMLVSNQENSINHLNREPLVNNIDVLGISDYRNGQADRSPVNPCAVNEGIEHLGINDEVAAFDNPLCNNSALHDDNLCNDNNNTCVQVKDEQHALQPKSLFTQTENAHELKTYFRESYYTHTNEQRNNSQQAGGNFNTEDVNYSNKNFDNNTSQDYADSRLDFPQFTSLEDSAHRYAWGENQQYYLPKGYDSDSDMLKDSMRNKKSSLDEPRVGSYPVFPEFPNQSKSPRGHRRVKSGDVLYAMSNVQPLNNTPRNVKHSLMQHSQSQGNISIPPESKQPLLNQSISVVDTPVANTDIHEHLCLQSTTFVALQAAIADAAKEVEVLELEVEAKAVELNAGLNVKQNPTHRECQLLEERIKNLTKEIQDMYNECDSLGVPVPGDTPPLDIRRTPSDTYPVYHVPAPMSSLYPITPSMPESTVPITVQPSPKCKQKMNSNYENILSYSKSKSAPIGCKLITSAPPPIPPRIPIVNEHWVCPSCTFNNLLVSDCEICLSPRPTTLR